MWSRAAGRFVCVMSTALVIDHIFLIGRAIIFKSLTRSQHVLDGGVIASEACRLPPSHFARRSSIDWSVSDSCCDLSSFQLASLELCQPFSLQSLDDFSLVLDDFSLVLDDFSLVLDDFSLGFVLVLEGLRGRAWCTRLQPPPFLDDRVRGGLVRECLLETCAPPTQTLSVVNPGNGAAS